MSLELLTIVIPTRDRTDLLELCLRSVYEHQTTVPNVIVSDNSTLDHPEIDVLRRKYGFAYVRRSGKLGITEHHNACLKLATTRWVWMLHDDDELYPNSVAKVESFLAECPRVGVAIGGVELINVQSKAGRQWVPKFKGTLRGEEALLGLGLNWACLSPSQIFGVRESAQIGGYADIGGKPADYSFAVLLAYKYGVAFYPEPIGRYRTGHEQVSDFRISPEKTADWIHFSLRQTELVIRESSCSVSAADRLRDYMCWWSFSGLATRWLTSHRSFVFQLTRQCLRASPQRGEWQDRVRRDFPFLFWRPQSIAWPLFRLLQTVNHLWRFVPGGRANTVTELLRPILFGKRGSRRES